MGVSVKVDIPNISAVSKRIFTPEVKKYANARLRAYCDPYVPFHEGPLSQNVETTEEYNHYKVPYAHKAWDGDDLNFSKDKHPLATAHWERAAMAAKGQQLADDITAYEKKR